VIAGSKDSVADSAVSESAKMPRRLPDIPSLHCESCGADRFIPLTYPSIKMAKEVDVQARPTSKCVTCGRRHFPPSAPSPTAAER
jgi:hypothetical protein